MSKDGYVNGRVYSCGPLSKRTTMSKAGYIKGQNTPPPGFSPISRSCRALTLAGYFPLTAYTCPVQFLVVLKSTLQILHLDELEFS